jgi:ABC-type bacteriocin/lantibiotic exporter with double-glycine peptidase domain
MLALGTVFAAELPGVWVDVPFIPQEKNGCGAAVLAMVMQYWDQQQGRASGPEADAEVIQRELYSRPAHGIYASELERYLDQHGFQTFALRGDWDDLKQHLSKGRPLIVALHPSSTAPLHYVVIAGVEDQQGMVLLNDPAQRKLLKESRSDFEREWSAAGKWTLLAVPRSASR